MKNDFRASFVLTLCLHAMYINKYINIFTDYKIVLLLDAASEGEERFPTAGKEKPRHGKRN